MTEMSDMSNVLLRLTEMSNNRYIYGLGDWWNAVDAAIEEIEDLQATVTTCKRIIKDLEPSFGERHGPSGE
jgi:hypothetical protein